VEEGLRRCIATTAAGAPCRRWACRIDGDHCTDHSPKRTWVPGDDSRRDRLRELVDLLDAPA